jgi:opacity protein-like surface antigen
VKKIIAIAVASLFAITAMAEGPAKTDTGINYNNVEVSYDSLTVNSYTWGGYGLNGNFLLGESVYATLNYRAMTPETSTFKNMEQTFAGIGYRFPVASSTDLNTDISYVSMTNTTTNTGYRLSVGAKSKIASAVELNGAYSYIDVGSSTYNAFTGGLKLDVTDSFYGYGRYTSMTGTNSITTYSLGLGMNF